MNVKNKLICLFVAFITVNAFAQRPTLPSSTRNVNCMDCTPTTGWQKGPGTPDISNSTNAGIKGSVAGSGATWNPQLPPPPNGHSRWISMRDVGKASGEESIYATMTNLVAGRDYAVTIYSLTAVTNPDGHTSNSHYYAGSNIEKFEFQVGTNTIVSGTGRILDPNHANTQPRVAISDIEPNVWGVNVLRFTASASTMYIAFYPGTDAEVPLNPTVAQYVEIEAVNISVTLNAINTIPVAQNHTRTTTQGVPTTIDIKTGAVEYDNPTQGPGGTIAWTNVDLDPSTPGIQNTLTNAQGTWNVNNNGVVTFMPLPSFFGTASIPYTIQDDYTLTEYDTNNNQIETPRPGVSNQKTLSVTITQSTTCPPQSIALNSFKLLNATGESLNVSNFIVGDKLLKTNAVTLNGVTFDAVATITSINVGTGANVGITGSGDLAIKNSASTNNPYVTYNVAFVQAGTVTNSNSNIVPRTLQGITIIMKDVDGNGISQHFTDVVGYKTSSNTPVVTAGSFLVNQGFQSGGPSGYNLYRGSTYSANTSGVLNAADTNSDYWVNAFYNTYTTEEFIFGVTGTRTNAIGERASWLSGSSSSLSCVFTCEAGTTQVSLSNGGLSNHPTHVAPGSILFYEDFGTSDLSINRGRKTSPYMPAGSYTFANSYTVDNTTNPSSTNLVESRIEDGYYAVVAPGHINMGWYRTGNGAAVTNPSWGSWWTRAHTVASPDDSSKVFTNDYSGTNTGAVMVINAGNNINAFYNRPAVLEIGSEYKASLQLYVAPGNAPTRLGIDIKDASTNAVLHTITTPLYATTEQSKWIPVSLQFVMPGTAAECGTSKNIIVSVRNDYGATDGNDYYVDDIMVQKLSDSPLCPLCVGSSAPNYVNLNSALAATQPSSASRVWFNGPNPLTATAVSDPTHVTVSGTYYAFFYDAIANCYNTTTSSAAVTVTIYNKCPITAKPDINQVPAGVTATGNVLSNDKGNALTASKFTYLNSAGTQVTATIGSSVTVYDATGNEAGLLTLNANGTYTFVPKSGYSGEVPIGYEAQESAGNTATSTLTIQVAPAVHLGSTNNPPIANDDTYTVENGQTATVKVLANDSDPDNDPLSVTEVKGYNATGSPAIVLTSSPQTVYDSSGVEAGTASINSNGEILFTPKANYNGVAPFDYTISDGNGGTDSATAYVKVIPDNGSTTDIYVNDDAKAAPKGTAMAGNISTNDTWLGTNPRVSTASASVNGTNYTLTLGNPLVIPNVGTLTLNSNGTYNYAPVQDFVGTVSVPYTAINNQGNADSAVLYLTTLDFAVCYETPSDTTSIVSVKHGITLLGRAAKNNSDTGNWPILRNSAYTVLESKTKGLVITRNSNPETTITNPVVGMMVFDTDEDSGKGCLKIYTGSGTGEGWKCYSSQTCP